ncbi:hypothetical protein HY441_02365 [Candidatus Microgenomates bacterium]|nr:hypothetical protein [Candidatus Microgenomates bacterium]
MVNQFTLKQLWRKQEKAIYLAAKVTPNSSHDLDDFTKQIDSLVQGRATAAVKRHLTIFYFGFVKDFIKDLRSVKNVNLAGNGELILEKLDDFFEKVAASSPWQDTFSLRTLPSIRLFSRRRVIAVRLESDEKLLRFQNIVVNEFKNLLLVLGVKDVDAWIVSKKSYRRLLETYHPHVTIFRSKRPLNIRTKQLVSDLFNQQLAPEITFYPPAWVNLDRANQH